MFDLLLDPSVWVAFLTLSFLEIILGIDNVIFITLLANKVPEKSRDKVRKFGLMVALVTQNSITSKFVMGHVIDKSFI